MAASNAKASSATPAMSLLILWVFQDLTISVISRETRAAKGHVTQLDMTLGPEDINL